MKTRISGRGILIGLCLTLGPAISLAGGTPFTSNTSLFSATFPTSPTQSETTDKTIVGAIHENTFVSKSNAGTFTVENSVLPGVAVSLGGHKEIFKKAKDGFFKKTGATELSSSDITLGGSPGMEFSFQTSGGLNGKAHLFLIGKRFYFLSGESSQAGAVDQFLNSFKALPDPGK